MGRVAKLSLTAVAALALSAVAAAPSALAAAEFEAEAYAATVAGAQTGTQVFALEEEGEVKCTNASFAGELAEPAETMKVLPAYSGCSAFGVAATVESGGCELVLRPSEESKENAYSGKADISCPKEGHITILAALKSCEVQIGSQSGLSSATYSDNLGASPPNLTVELNLGEVHANVTKDGAFCPLSGTGERTNGSLTGNSLLKGSIGGEQIGLAAIPAGNTRLCEAEPEAKTAKCPAGKTYPANTSIAGPLVEGEQAGMVFSPLSQIRCQQSSVSMQTKEKEGSPLNLESLSATFATCEFFEAPNSAQCETVNMTNSPTKAKMWAGPNLHAGWGTVFTPMTLLFECGALLKCQYSATNQELWIKGSKKPELTPGFPRPRFIRQAIAGEVGCSPTVEWFGAYTLEPQPLWATR
jgi:hypothetical protein